MFHKEGVSWQDVNGNYFYDERPQTEKQRQAFYDKMTRRDDKLREKNIQREVAAEARADERARKKRDQAAQRARGHVYHEPMTFQGADAHWDGHWGSVGKHQYTEFETWYANARTAAERAAAKQAQQEAKEAQKQADLRESDAAAHRAAARKKAEAAAAATAKESAEADAREAEERIIRLTAEAEALTVESRRQLALWANASARNRLDKRGEPDWESVVEALSPAAPKPVGAPADPSPVSARDIEGMRGHPGLKGPKLFWNATAVHGVQVDGVSLSSEDWVAQSSRWRTVPDTPEGFADRIGTPLPEEYWTEAQRAQQRNPGHWLMHGRPKWTQDDATRVADAVRAENDARFARVFTAVESAYAQGLESSLRALAQSLAAVDRLPGEMIAEWNRRAARRAEEWAAFGENEGTVESGREDRAAQQAELVRDLIEPMKREYESGSGDTVEALFEAAASHALRGYSEYPDRVMALWDAESTSAVVDVVTDAVAPALWVAQYSAVSDALVRTPVDVEETRLAKARVLRELSLRISAECFSRDWRQHASQLVVNVWSDGRVCGGAVRQCACRVSVRAGRADVGAIGGDADALLRRLGARIAPTLGDSVEPLATNLSEGGVMPLGRDRMRPFLMAFEV